MLLLLPGGRSLKLSEECKTFIERVLEVLLAEFMEYSLVHLRIPIMKLLILKHGIPNPISNHLGVPRLS